MVGDHYELLTPEVHMEVIDHPFQCIHLFLDGIIVLFLLEELL